MNLKIEKNIPFLPRERVAIVAPKILLALDKMKSGDSFIIPAKHRGYVQTLARGKGFKIAIKCLEDRPEYVRAWRIK
jgi:hypothetical protein